jgi:UDP-N-acetylmuramoylalanine--D-glutamate ligase
VRTLVVGLRATGSAVARWLVDRGDVVTVAEDRPGQAGYRERRRAVEAIGAEVVEMPGDWDALVAVADLVVPSPGVRPDHPVMLAAAARGVPVRGDLDLAVEAATVPVVVVTGTNGKSTVVTLVSAMLEASGRRAPAVGNIGTVAVEALGTEVDVLVVEASSFQLHTITPAFRPAVATLLNLAPDHVDWHGSYEAYVADKVRMFEHLGPGAVAVTNLDDGSAEVVCPPPTARVVGFSLRPVPGAWSWHGDTLRDDRGESMLTAVPDWAPHERADVAAAAASARPVGATPEGIAAAAGAFTRLHHRTESIGKAGGVRYVDDSKATNPHAAVAAVRGFERVVLLAGGDSKGVDLGPLRSVADRLRAVVAIGDTPEEVEAVFAGAVPTERATSMADAVARAARLAEPGDTVLLSPACASFDWYDSYAQRGDDFRAAVQATVGGA